jgi:hypothetical protein
MIGETPPLEMGFRTFSGRDSALQYSMAAIRLSGRQPRTGGR